MDGQGGGGFLPGWSWLLWLHIRETNGLRGEKKKTSTFSLPSSSYILREMCVCVCVCVLSSLRQGDFATRYSILLTYVRSFFFSFVGVGENHEK